MTATSTAQPTTDSASAVETTFLVVLSDEERYSIWPDYKDIPWGWRAEGFSGPKQACLDHIETVWTDMRPLSLRRAMEADAAAHAAANPGTTATASTERG